jgi:hypothetical protein
MVPLRGWAPRGERLKAKVPHRRWKTMTFLAALRFDRVEAPWLIDGPINGEVLPRLCRAGGGSHAAPRRYRDHGQAQLAQGCRFPPYSPDLNPIEQAFAKLKALLRANALRTVGALWKALGELVACFAPAECAYFLRHAGYFWSS